MLIWIICSGPTGFTWDKSYDNAGFLAAQRTEEDSPVLPSQVHPMKGGDRPILAAPGRRAADTARMFLGDRVPTEEPLLAPAEPESTSGGQRSPKSWRRQCLAAARKRTDALLERLEQTGEDYTLIAAPEVVEVLLDRLRVKGYCQARSGIFSLKPLELIQASLREDHCGGCGHNCMLSNPGCGIGRDKANRLGVRYRVE